MKICIVSNFKKNGYGESTRPYFLSLFLKQQGHDILHLCRHSGKEGGIEYVQIDTEHWERNPIKRLIGFVSLYLKVKLFEPDIIYVHQLNNARWAVATRVLSGSKLILDAHTSVYFELSTFEGHTPTVERVKIIEADTYKKADYIIAASDETRNLLLKEIDLSPDKIFTVGNATNLKPLTSAEKKVVEEKKEGFTCLTTIPFDGFRANELALAYLFEIAQQVYETCPAIKFMVVGGGEKPTPPTPNIIYTGYVTDLRKEILAADICIMPYPDNAVCGGARNKFCDFIALGKVVITSPEGLRGMEILKDKGNCFVAESKIGFAGLITELYQSPEKILAMEERIFGVRNYYDWSDRASQVAKIFEKILKVK